MPEKILSSFKVSKISKFLDKQFIGNDIKINKICSIGKVLNNSISFINEKEQKIDQSKKSLIIAIDNYKIDRNSNCTFIYSSNPKLDFIKILNHFFLKENKKKISDTVIIGKNCKIKKNVFIGEHTVIKDNVIIEEGTVIKNFVYIESNTKIGKNCHIKSSSILGEHGFGFERNEQGNPIRFPHIGNLIIKDNVEIGAFNTVSRGSIDNTYIDEFTKIDDHVHIAHNVCIGKKNIICAGTIFGGSSKIGNSNFIGLNSTIKDGIKIGNKNFIGQSTNVIKSVEDNNLIYGNPGMIIKK